MSNPRPQQPGDDPALHPNHAPQRSLVESLGDVADDLRQLYTDVGLRPYRMLSVVYRWTGGEVGRGEPIVVSQEDFLPTPNVTPAVRGSLREGGLVERGDVRVTQISPRYTEAQVRGLFHCNPLPAGMEGFIEIVMDARDGDDSPRRRFTVIGVPVREADRFHWTATLTRQDASRLPDGQPNPVGLRLVR